MIEILINDIEQAMLNTLNNEQLCQLHLIQECGGLFEKYDCLLP